MFIGFRFSADLAVGAGVQVNSSSGTNEKVFKNPSIRSIPPTGKF